MSAMRAASAASGLDGERRLWAETGNARRAWNRIYPLFLELLHSFLNRIIGALKYCYFASAF